MEGKELPKLVYVSREKRPGYNHHKKAGAMNALVSIKQKPTIYLSGTHQVDWTDCFVWFTRFECLQCLQMHRLC